MVSIGQLFATVELGANKPPLLTSASVTLDLLALQRSGGVKGLVVSIVAATKLAGGGSFDLHFVFHYVNTISYLPKKSTPEMIFFNFFLLLDMPILARNLLTGSWRESCYSELL
ncbi:MAG: hypothetical protein DWQ49_05455 [Bacteroidetes bacterium]|nr:MAG: hypothetical protein DWQ49_05455 [Bacteroidota bacterium]